MLQLQHYFDEFPHCFIIFAQFRVVKPMQLFVIVGEQLGIDGLGGVWRHGKESRLIFQIDFFSGFFLLNFLIAVFGGFAFDSGWSLFMHELDFIGDEGDPVLVPVLFGRLWLLGLVFLFPLAGVRLEIVFRFHRSKIL